VSVLGWFVVGLVAVAWFWALVAVVRSGAPRRRRRRAPFWRRVGRPVLVFVLVVLCALAVVLLVAAGACAWRLVALAAGGG
jgi:hypothetical protein